MSGSAWAAIVLLVLVLGVLAGLFWAVRLHFRDQELEDGGRAYDRAEGTAWFGHRDSQDA